MDTVRRRLPIINDREREGMLRNQVFFVHAALIYLNVAKNFQGVKMQFKTRFESSVSIIPMKLRFIWATTFICAQ
jgi:hypothetical protein